jgi:hypothetical protein
MEDIIQELLPMAKAYIEVYAILQMIAVVFAMLIFIKLLKEF